MFQAVTVKRVVYVVGPFLAGVGAWFALTASAPLRAPSASELSIAPRAMPSPAAVAEQFYRLKQYENEVKQYENELRVRSTVIENLLNDVRQSDEDGDTMLRDRRETYTDTISRTLGIGGGDERVSPLYSVHALRAPSKTAKLIKPQSFHSMIDYLDYQIDKLEHAPIGLPVPGQITSGFGYRVSPFSGRMHNHTGLDVSVENKSPVRVTADGTVIFAGYKGAYGQTVIIDHGSNVETLYGHMSSILVKAGSKVCRGEQIGTVGMTGNTTGPHVHYEVRIKGDPINPAPFVQLARLTNRIG